MIKTGRRKAPTDKSPVTKGKPRSEPTTGNPCIEITPTPAEYEQLCNDLKTLRSAGATSNTSAILEAVRVAAKGPKLVAPRKSRAARTRPPARATGG